MAICYTCNSFKPDNGQCPNCAKMEADKRLADARIASDERLASEQREANEELARRNIRAQERIAAHMAADSQKKHDELMEMEEVRLNELKKQTQILLEQGLTEDEVYQKGQNFEERYMPSLFDIDDHEVILKLNDRGDIVAEYDNPYVQQKFRQAYKKGVEDRLKRDYSKGPGIEFMSEEAFNAGYKVNSISDSRGGVATIYFPNKKSIRFIYRALSDPDASVLLNEEDGTLECYWNEPYDAEVLNDSFEAGVKKYLKEQNTAAKKKSRLAEIHLEQAEQRAIKAANDEAEAARAKEQAEKDSQEKLFKSIKAAFSWGLFGAVLGLPLFALIYICSVFIGGTSWTLVGFVESLAAIGAVLGFFSEL
jgi:hypothetical protein